MWNPRSTVYSEEMPENAESLRPTKGDVYLAIGLAVASMVFAVLYVSTGVWPIKAPLWVLCLTSAAVAAPLIWRRRHPSLVAWIQAAVYVVAQIAAAIEPGVTQIILFMGIYSIGAWQRSRRTAFISRLLLCLAIFAYIVTSMIIQFAAVGGDMSALQIASSFGVNLLTNVVYFGGGWLFGSRAWKQRVLLTELRSATEEVRSQEQQLTKQAIDLERVRIARELHDGIAHHITGVGIHAAAARRSLEKNPDRARESLKTIESSTRETVDELRALVYTLRDTNDEGTAGGGAKGNPSLGDLPELIESSRRLGQSVEFTTIGQPRPLTPITEMSIYRVAQESLTNCRRYAGTHTEVAVRLRYGAAALEVEISDSGADSTAPPQDEKPAGIGLGIVGMRERMTALGGSLDAGPKSRGGWLVRARIPYPRSTAEPNEGASATDTETRTGSNAPTSSSTPTAKA